MLTPVRVLAVGLVAALSTGLLAVSLSGPSADRAGGFGAPGASPSAMTSPASRQPIDWDTGCVHLTADEMRINTDTAGDEPGQVFTVEDPVMLNSDPGADTYRTLEATWQEGGSEMRLNLYFAADEDSWWVREVRTYDGQPTPDWITYPGPLFETPLGETYAGRRRCCDRQPGERAGHARDRGMTLSAPDFGPGTGPATCTQTVAGGERRDSAPPRPVRPPVQRPAHPPSARPPMGWRPRVASALAAISDELLDGLLRTGRGRRPPLSRPHRGRRVRLLRAHRRPDRRAGRPDRRDHGARRCGLRGLRRLGGHRGRHAGVLRRRWIRRHRQAHSCPVRHRSSRAR